MLKYFDKEGYNEKYNVFKSRYMAKKWAEKTIKNGIPLWADDTYTIIKINKYYRIIWYNSILNI